MSEAPDGAAEAVTEDTAAAELEATEETQAQGDEQSGDDATATDEQDPAPERRRQTATERVKEAVKAQREAEREREYWREQALRNQQPATREETPADDGEPDPNNYDHGELDVRFIRDHATYHARRTFREEQARAEAQNRFRTAINTFEQRVEEQFPDGEPEGLAALRRLPPLSPIVEESILDSEIGPKLADHLGQNIRELNRISALPPIKQARELAKLELRLASPPAPTAKIATDAPPVTPQVRGAGGQFKPAADTDDFKAFQSTYGAQGR